MFSKHSFPEGIGALTADSLCMKNNTEISAIAEKSWQERAKKAEAQIQNLLKEMEYLKAQMWLLTAKRYGASSEKSKQDNNQMSLFDSAFNKAEASAEAFAPEPELVRVPAHKRKKSKGKKDSSLKACQKTSSNTILPRMRWSVRIAVTQGMLSARKLPESLLSYRPNFLLTCMYKTFVAAATANQTGMAASKLSLQLLNQIEHFLAAFPLLRWWPT